MKTTFTYDQYVDYEGMNKMLTQLKNEYPALLDIQSLIKTEEDKDVLAVTVTNFTSGNPQDKPAYYIDANIHAGEVTGSMTALYTIDALCTNSQDPKISYLLDHYTFYIIPKVSPDGADAYLNSAEKLRSVNRFYPFSEKEDGLHPEDIDGDGFIRMMRVQTPYGVWKVSAADERVMTKRLATDLDGPFYHVYPEGFIKNYDGLHVTLAKNKWGLDFNRNFPFGWFSEMRQPGSGKYPLSNPETHALSDFILDHPNIGFVSTLHTTGGVLIYPPGTYSEKQAIASDMKIYHDMGKPAKILTGYDTKNVFDEFLVDTDNYSSGAFDDWCYEVQGIPAFTIELWDCLLRAGVPYDSIRKSHKSDEENEATYIKTLAWIDQNVGQDAFKPWTAFEHPDLGTVEIGGFDFKFTIQNPPAALLEQEAAKMAAYLIESAAALPILSVDHVQTEKIADDLYKIDAVVGNTGYLGTFLTQKAIDQKVNQPVTVSLIGDVSVIEGEASQSIGDLGGFAQVLSDYGYDGISTAVLTPSQKKCTFIIQGKEDTIVTLQAAHPKAGTFSVNITLS